MKNLVGISPHIALPHGPSKVYLDEFLWHSPALGVVASYTPTENDTQDHFGIYRGADQIESFGQASVVAANAFLSCKKKNIGFEALYGQYNFVFMAIGEAACKSFIKLGDVALIYAHIDNCKFRQMTASGKIYKVHSGIDLRGFYNDYGEDEFKNNDLPKSAVEVTEFRKLIGRGIKNELIEHH